MIGSARRLFVFGLGYSALRLAERLRASGWSVAGTCRGEDKRALLATRGIAAHVFDRDRKLADLAVKLAGATHILSSVPPDGAGDPVLAAHQADLAALKGVRWVGYLSTTGVYGDRDGEWVDEKAGLHPTGERGRKRVEAEQAWLGLGRFGLAVHVFRLAGIYGPGRSALDTMRAGNARRVVKPGQVFSRAHVEDIAAAIEASMSRPNGGAIYNVCDDDPAPPQDVIAYAAALLGAPSPPEIPYAEAKAGMSEMARSFYADNKRVANTRIKTELGVKLEFPDYRAGLRAILGQERLSRRRGAERHEDGRVTAPSAERNKAPILDALRRVLPRTGLVLEIASGTGQHVAHFAEALPDLVFQPAERDPAMHASIAGWAGDLPNLRPPLALDVENRDWPAVAADAVICINMIHVAPWAATLALMRGAGRILAAGGVLFLYGPYKRAGAHTAPSNAAFDADLSLRNPDWGVRDLEAVVEAAQAEGFRLEETVEMPANNLAVALRKF